jgi:predicted DNA-binding protein (MmcQ/YjbR family)
VTPKQAVQTLRKAALGYEGVEEGVACAGTVLESATFKAKKKAFLFVNEKSARLRLTSSRGEAEELAKKSPERFQIGPQGWAKIFLSEPPALELMLRWLDESYRAVTKAR